MKKDTLITQLVEKLNLVGTEYEQKLAKHLLYMKKEGVQMLITVLDIGKMNTSKDKVQPFVEEVKVETPVDNSEQQTLL